MDALEVWLNTFTSPYTRSQYLSYVRTFLRFIYGKGDVYQQAEQYLEERRGDIIQIMNDIDRYWGTLNTLTPKARKNRISGIKIFLRDQYIELPSTFWIKFTRRGLRLRPVSDEIILNSEQLRRILSHLRERGRAFVHVLASTGARIGEILRIEFRDLALEKDPPRIYLRPEITKNKLERVVFLTDEAKEALQDWLRVHDEFIIKKRGPPAKHPERVFDFMHDTAYFVWNSALAKVGLNMRDKKTGWHLVRIHGLRKRFRTLLATVIPVDVVEALMGHVGYLTDAYRRYSEEDLAQWFKKGSHVLIVNSEKANVAKLVGDLAKERENMQRELENRDAEIRLLKREMAEIKALLAKLELSR